MSAWGSPTIFRARQRGRRAELAQDISGFGADEPVFVGGELEQRRLDVRIGERSRRVELQEIVRADGQRSIAPRRTIGSRRIAVRRGGFQQGVGALVDAELAGRQGEKIAERDALLVHSARRRRPRRLSRSRIDAELRRCFSVVAKFGEPFVPQEVGKLARGLPAGHAGSLQSVDEIFGPHRRNDATSQVTNNPDARSNHQHHDQRERRTAE